MPFVGQYVNTSDLQNWLRGQAGRKGSQGSNVKFYCSLTKLRPLLAPVAIFVLSLVLVGHGQCAIVTSGDVSPGPPGPKPNPWNPGLLAVGISGDGSLTVNNGSVLNTTTAYVALNTGSSASFQLSGPGSTWNNSGSLTLGDSGIANAVIEDGALVHIGGSVTMGDSAAGTTVLIGSLNSSNPATLQIDDDLYLGGGATGPSGGSATLTIGQGGRLETSGQTYVYTGSSIDPGPNSFESGGVNLAGGNLLGTDSLSLLNLQKTGNVSGYGSIISNIHLGSNGLINGDPGEALIVDGTLAGSGTLQGVIFGGSLGIGEPLTNLLGSPLTIDRVVGSIVFRDVTVSPNTVFDFGVHGTGLDEFDKLLLTGSDNLDGIAQIEFVQGFVPDPSDTFQLVERQSGSNSSGWFSEVYTPSNWLLNRNGLLYYQTPEPTTLMISLIGLAVIGCCRRIFSGCSRRAD